MERNGTVKLAGKRGYEAESIPLSADASSDEFSVGDAPEQQNGEIPNDRRKRQRTEAPSQEGSSFAYNGGSEMKGEQLDQAKKKLSKWAARLFDPDRPRGLVEAPKTIPLNDEFLTAFGKREKEFDEATGREIEIDTAISDGEEDGDNDSESWSKSKTATPIEGRKVKITNLAYSLTQEELRTACEAFGSCEEVNLLMDKEKDNMNAGRAYVTFEKAEDANNCVNNLKVLSGRNLRVSLAVEDPNRTRRSTPSKARYWETDISTKCFRCGQVGHMAGDCPNEKMEKPCLLCANIGHEFYACPLSRICFNCGVPGHINRDCPQPRGLPKRLVCGTCFQSGHHRVSCRQFGGSAYDARCMVCGELGHFMCKQIERRHQLEGMSCFNCGQMGHHGFDCDRPGLDVCARDAQVAQQEIEQAEARSLANELNEQKKRSKGFERGREMERDSSRGRAKSQPPPSRSYGNSYGGGNIYGGVSNHGSQRGYTQQHRGYQDPSRGYGGNGGQPPNRGNRWGPKRR